MKFTLKDYQSDAVADVLRNLASARTLYRQSDPVQTSSFSLTATTGAGKTVMAAAAIEALFWGSDDFDFAPDAGAVVIWFSDDPNLNDQTRTRLQDASEKFTSSNLVTIEPPFAKPRLEAGKVYFLNTQKLGKKSRLTRGHVDRSDGQASITGFGAATPDDQAWTIWQTLAGTIEDPNLTLYLVLDEAHRGFDGKDSRDRQTIVRRLVNGTQRRPAIPIVWGISATIERFEAAMRQAEATSNRQALKSVLVDPGRVQESGLVKDTLALDIPDEAGTFDSVLVRRAARKLRDSTERWAAYAESQGLVESVQPLLVLQTPNTPDPDDVGVALDTIFDEYPELRGDSVRHVLGEHKPQRYGAWEVDWIEPQRVQREPSVRVLIAKDAISTGWDCPRAEVLVSFRPAKDNTHITQLLGRMVRSPLAMRVPGDERLNTVDCILPFFDRTTAVKVVRFMTGDLELMPGSEKKVVIDGKELLPNPHVPQSVWDLWATLPTQTMPRRGARPVKRLVALAQALAADGVRPGALKEAEAEMHRILDAYATRYGPELDKAVQEVWDVHGQVISRGFGENTGVKYEQYIERGDDRSIRSDFEAARKAFGADIAQSYVNHLAGNADDADDDGLREAYVRAAALANVKDVREKVDTEALELTQRLFAEHRVDLKGLPDTRQQEYDDIRALATEPQRSSPRLPRTRIEGFTVESADGQLETAYLVPLHLMSDEEGQFPISSFNTWERLVVATELRRSNVLAWYRNPPRATFDSLGIAYRGADGTWRSMHPDFLFFHEVKGEVVASIIDPHGHHLDDASTKLKALAAFAATYGDEFHRIEAIAEADGQMRVLDMLSSDVRDAALAGSDSPVDLYKSGLSTPYDAVVA